MNQINNHTVQELNEVKMDMVELKTDIKYTKQKVESIECKLDKFIETADNKFASKNVEKIVYGLVALIVVAVFTALMSTVL